MKAILLLLPLLSILSWTDYDQRILYRSGDIMFTDSTQNIRKIRAQQYTKYLKVIYLDGKKVRFPKDSVWGFVDKKDRVYRLYHRQLYRVIKNNDFVQYAYTSNHGKFRSTTYRRYSRTLDSKIVNRQKKI